MYRIEPLLLTCLGELRAIFGIHVGRLAYVYDLKIEDELASILPVDDVMEEIKQMKAGPTQRPKKKPS